MVKEIKNRKDEKKKPSMTPKERRAKKQQKNLQRPSHLEDFPAGGGEYQ